MRGGIFRPGFAIVRRFAYLKQDYICAGALTEEALTGAVSDFLYRVRPHRERLWDAYEGQQPVP